MSSDEDFSLDTEVQQPPEGSKGGVRALISCFKKKCELLQQEHEELKASRDQQEQMAQKFRQRATKMAQSLEESQRLNKEKLEKEQAKLKLLQLEEATLIQEIEQVEAALKEEEAQNKNLRRQNDVFTAAPERNVFFNGQTADAAEGPVFDMEPRIVYPMDGGTVLVTFEEEEVANKILDMKKHQVSLGAEVSISVEARPVHMLLPKVVEVASEVCPRRILISNLPKMDVETLLNKLEIHFSKRKNGGGEVDTCEMMLDSWTVVLTFVEKHIARGLTETQHHKVQLQKTTTHRVKVTPFLNGSITNLKTEMSACPRTVLLTGIPDVMERDTLQDLIEIHFQKRTNGGGEIEALLYNPLGQHTSALFDGVSKDRENK